MQEAISSNKDLLDILVQLLIVVIPVVISWFIRTYVRGSVAERDLAAVIRLSNAAIDYVENLDKRGELDLPSKVKKGGYKLKLAGQWLESELQRAGIKISDQEAQQWIASEFQKRIGNVQMVGTIAQLTGAAVDLIQNLEQSGLVDPPPNIDRITHLAGLAADWVVAQFARLGARISREEALIWVRAELLHRLQTESSTLPVDEQLTNLAKQAVSFLDKLKASGQLTIQPGPSGANVETDIAVAWLLTKAAKQGMAVTPNQIAEVVIAALRQRNAEPA